MSTLTRGILPILVLAAFLLVAYLITQTKPDASRGTPTEPPRLVVEVERLMAGPFNVELDSFGVVQARTNSDLFALVSGQITSVSPRFESGGFFKQGDILLEIERVDYEVEVQVAKGNLVNAELALAEEEARFEQAQRDWKKNKPGIEPNDYALRLPQLRAAKANIETAKARLALAEINLERTRVRAPYDGRINKVFVDRGSVVGSGSILAKIYSTDVIEIRLPVSNKDLRFLTLPETIISDEELLPQVLIENTLTEPAETWQGRVVRTEAAVDAASQQLYVVAQVSNPFLESDPASREQPVHQHPLKIGQYVRATIKGKQLDDVITIPNSSLYQGSYVYIVEGEQLQRQPVSVLWKNQQVSIIDTGLEAGQRLVTTLLGQVASGTLVEERNGSESEGVQP